MSVRQDRYHFSGWMLLIFLASAGMKWFPIITTGSLSIEANNLGALVLIAAIPLFVIGSGFRLVIPPLVALILISNILLWFAFSIRGQPRGVDMLAVTFPAALACLGVLGIAPVVVDNLRKYVWLAFLLMNGLVVVSAHIAGVNIMGGAMDYLTTLNRNALLFQVIRPIFNAFAPAGDTNYLATMMNEVAAAYTVFFIIAGSLVLRGGWRMWLVLLLSFLINFVMFSSSAVMVIGLSSLIMVLRWFAMTRSWIARISVIWILMMAAVMLAPAIGHYIGSSVSGDAGSRGMRLDQYIYAVHKIEQNMFMGIGYVTIDGNVIHNYFLFSWVSAGILGATIAVAVFAMTLHLIFTGIYGVLYGRAPELQMMVALLSFLFLIRILFSGGGGIPSGIGIVAIALALLIRRRVRQLEMAAPRVAVVRAD
jgi:hypothetical protein